MSSIKDFATGLMDRYLGDLDVNAAFFVTSPYAAGEFEAAAISIIEDAPVTLADVDELERLAVEFDAVDKKVADIVIAKRRKQLAA